MPRDMPLVTRGGMSRSSWSRCVRFVSLVVLSAVLLTAAASAQDEQPDAAASASRLYEVKDGNKVDATTLQGWQTWRALEKSPVHHRHSTSSGDARRAVDRCLLQGESR